MSAKLENSVAPVNSCSPDSQTPKTTNGLSVHMISDYVVLLSCAWTFVMAGILKDAPSDDHA